MYLTDKPVLDELKAMVEAIGDITLTGVYIAPDETISRTSYTVPFCTVGVLEGHERTIERETFGTPAARYGVFLRFYLKSGVVETSTPEYDAFELLARDIEQHVSEAVVSMSPDTFMFVSSLESVHGFMPMNSSEHTAVQFSWNLVQAL